MIQLNFSIIWSDVRFFWEIFAVVARISWTYFHVWCTHLLIKATARRLRIQWTRTCVVIWCIVLHIQGGPKK